MERTAQGHMEHEVILLRCYNDREPMMQTRDLGAACEPVTSSSLPPDLSCPGKWVTLILYP